MDGGGGVGEERFRKRHTEGGEGREGGTGGVINRKGWRI